MPRGILESTLDSDVLAVTPSVQRIPSSRDRPVGQRAASQPSDGAGPAPSRVSCSALMLGHESTLSLVRTLHFTHTAPCKHVLRAHRAPVCH